MENGMNLEMNREMNLEVVHTFEYNITLTKNQLLKLNLYNMKNISYIPSSIEIESVSKKNEFELCGNKGSIVKFGEAYLEYSNKYNLDAYKYILCTMNDLTLNCKDINSKMQYLREKSQLTIKVIYKYVEPILLFNQVYIDLTDEIYSSIINDIIKSTSYIQQIVFICGCDDVTFKFTPIFNTSCTDFKTYDFTGNSLIEISNHRNLFENLLFYKLVCNKDITSLKVLVFGF